MTIEGNPKNIMAIRDKKKFLGVKGLSLHNHTENTF